MTLKTTNLLGTAVLTDVDSVLTKVKDKWYSVPLTKISACISTIFRGGTGSITIYEEGNTNFNGTGLKIANPTYRSSLQFYNADLSTSEISFRIGTLASSSTNGFIQYNYTTGAFSYRAGGTSALNISATGLNIGNTLAAIGKLTIPISPTATSNYGLACLGNGPWDGITAGFFTGSVLGTTLAINNISGYSGDLAVWQIGGVTKLKVNNLGDLTLAGGVIVDKGTVTQAGAITTAVTINKSAGVITTVASTLGAGSNAAFTVYSSFCLPTSVIQLCEDDVLTAGWAKANVQNITAGAFDINITNIHPINSFNNVINIHFIIV